jgi:hypothetical protein
LGCFSFIVIFVGPVAVFVLLGDFVDGFCFAEGFDLRMPLLGLPREDAGGGDGEVAGGGEREEDGGGEGEERALGGEEREEEEASDEAAGDDILAALRDRDVSSQREGCYRELVEDAACD